MGGLLLKTMDYIIEWNAPAPVYGLQASCRLFPGSIARVVRLHNTAAGRFFFSFCSLSSGGYVLDWLRLLNGSHEMHSNTVIPL